MSWVCIWIAYGISKILKRKGTKSFLPPADSHGHELQGLVKMRQVKKYLNSLEKLSHVGVENFNDLF